MAIREILLADHPKLRQKAKKVSKFNANLKKLAEDMFETMHNANGVGLAGPQIGVMQRIFVAEVPAEYEEDPNAGQRFVLVNPKIVTKSEEKSEGQEGCLSIPGWLGLVNRHEAVTIKARNENGKLVTIDATGFLARIFQHENDHLDGVLFIDHISEKEKLWQPKPPNDEEDDA